MRETSDAGSTAARSLREPHPGPAHGLELADALAAARQGGKRLRPRMVEHAAACFGGDGRSAVDPAAVAAVADAVEWLHTAFVVHDDVIDRDDVRRGEMSIPGRFAAEGSRLGANPAGARIYAVAGAVLTGDLALAAAFRALASAPVEAERKQALFDLVDNALATSASGELADVRFSIGADVPDLKDVLGMEADKTAAYTFSLPMAAGALLAGASHATIEAVGAVGRLLGLGFQLSDDLDGMFANGRSEDDDPEAGADDKTISDLREGKMTALMVHASQTPHWPRIAEHLGDPYVTRAELELARRALEDSGSRTFVEQLVVGLDDSASALATEHDLPADLVPGILRLCGRPDELGAA